MQLLVGESANLAGFALPDDRGFILAPGFDMAIQAVIREVDLAPDEPFRPRAIPFENLVPLLEPVKFAGNPRPEFVGVVDGFLVEMLVFVQRLDVGLFAELGRRLELALLIQNGIDVRALIIDHSFIGHNEHLDADELCLRAGWRGTRSQEFILHSAGPDVIGITSVKALRSFVGPPPPRRLSCEGRMPSRQPARCRHNYSCQGWLRIPLYRVGLRPDQPSTAWRIGTAIFLSRPQTKISCRRAQKTLFVIPVTALRLKSRCNSSTLSLGVPLCRTVSRN